MIYFKNSLFHHVRILEEYESMYEEASADVSKYLANPLNAYLLVKRLTSDWKKVEGVMSKNAASGMNL
jgi:prolyl 4-hydroxylase